VTAGLPYVPFASRLGLAPPSGAVVTSVVLIVVAYLAANELLKARFRHVWGPVRAAH
jgi:hypothetical protein